MNVCCSQSFLSIKFIIQIEMTNYNYFDLSLTIVGAQPNVNMKPEAQSPEFL